jgi:hypothetical protein
MDKSGETACATPEPAMTEASREVGTSFERSCLTASRSARRATAGARREPRR